jgi:hypothetical protein
MNQPTRHIGNIVCTACGAQITPGLISAEERVRLSQQPSDPSWLDKLELLHRVQAFFERYPEADRSIRPYLTRLLDSPDPEVQRKLCEGEPFSEIMLPGERLPLTPEVQEAEREVIDYLHRSDCALDGSSRAARIAELTAAIEHDRRPVHCPWCGAGVLRADEPSAADEDECSSFYYPWPGCRSPDGSFVMRASWYDNEGHSSGLKEVRRSDPDYDLWCWIVNRPRRFERVTDADLDAIRREYSHWQRGRWAWIWFRVTQQTAPPDDGVSGIQPDSLDQ